MDEKQTPPRHETAELRARAARALAEYRAELTKRLGGFPTPTQAGRVEFSARLVLKLRILDNRFALRGFDDLDRADYALFSALHRQALVELGLAPAAPTPPEPPPPMPLRHVPRPPPPRRVPRDEPIPAAARRRTS